VSALTLSKRRIADVASVARPETILGWYRKLVARKFDGSKARRCPGRPRISREIEALIVRLTLRGLVTYYVLFFIHLESRSRFLRQART